MAARYRLAIDPLPYTQRYHDGVLTTEAAALLEQRRQQRALSAAAPAPAPTVQPATPATATATTGTRRSFVSRKVAPYKSRFTAPTAVADADVVIYKDTNTRSDDEDDAADVFGAGLVLDGQKAWSRISSKHLPPKHPPHDRYMGSTGADESGSDSLSDEDSGRGPSPSPSPSPSPPRSPSPQSPRPDLARFAAKQFAVCEADLLARLAAQESTTAALRKQLLEKERLYLAELNDKAALISTLTDTVSRLSRTAPPAQPPQAKHGSAEPESDADTYELQRLQAEIHVLAEGLSYQSQVSASLISNAEIVEQRALLSQELVYRDVSSLVWWPLVLWVFIAALLLVLILYRPSQVALQGLAYRDAGESPLFSLFDTVRQLFSSLL